jgi:hypothetical protein
MPVPRAWSYGEVSPSLQKRCDLDSYQRSAKTLRNWKVMREGGIETRSGTKLVAPTKYATTEDINCVLRPFVFNSAEGNTYAIEIGHEYMRFHKNGAQVREPAVTITAISKTNPGVVTYSGTDPSNGDEVYISGVYGMREINGQWYKVANVNAGANTFELTDRDGSNVSTTGYTTYTSGGTFEVVYEISTTYLYSDVYDLSLAQINDVISIVHPDYAPATLTRTSDTDWDLANVYQRDDWLVRVAELSGTAGTAGSKTFKYKVAYVSTLTGKESLPGTEALQTVTAITNAEPPVVTVASHGYSDGDTVVFNGVEGMTEINGREFTIHVATAFVPDTPVGITNITNASPMVVTANGHGYSNGDKIYFDSVLGMTELNAIEFGTVTNKTANTFEVYYFGTTTKIDSTGYSGFSAGNVIRISPNPTATDTFELVNVDSTNWGVFNAGGGDHQVGRTTLYIDAAADPTSSAPHVLEWQILNISGLADYSSTVREYVIYKEQNGVFGFVGLSKSPTFNDVGSTPDTGDTPYQYSEPFLDPFDYPRACGFGKQRLWYAGMDNHPNRCVSSGAGNYFNFYEHAITVSSDPMTIDLVSRTANIVQAIKEVAGRVIAFASEGEFGLGDTDGVIDANQPDAQHFTSHGSTRVQPLLINDIATYVQARGAHVRDLGFNFESNNYRGDERSTRSRHLFDGHTIVDWAYQQMPDSTIWAVRDDGVLLGCTYVREEQMAAWHRHDIEDSTIDSVCSIPGGDEDDLYMVVGLTVDGSPRRYVAVMGSRFIDDVVDNTFTDGSVRYDGRNTSATQMKLTGGSTWAAGELMTLQADTAYFNSRGSENVGNSVFLYDEDDAVIKCEITAYTDSTHVTVSPDRAVPTAMRNTYTASWSYAQTYIDGLWPLEGLDVSVFADGFVVASAKNERFYGTPLTVTDGRVDLGGPYEVISAGLPFLCDMEPVDIDSTQVPGGGLIHIQKIVNKLWIAVEQSRGLWIGSEPPSDDDDDPIENLEPLQGRPSDAQYDDTPPLDTDTFSNDTVGSWNSHGRVFIRQIDPVPGRILAIMPEGSTGI